MHVVRHEAIGPDFHAMFAGLRGEKIAVDVLVAVLEKDRLAPVSTLGDVVRQTRYDNTCETGHAKIVSLVREHDQSYGRSRHAPKCLALSTDGRLGIIWEM